MQKSEKQNKREKERTVAEKDGEKAKERNKTREKKTLRWNEIEYICLISNKYGEPGVVIEIIDALDVVFIMLNWLKL